MSDWATRLKPLLTPGDEVSFDPAYLRKISSYSGTVASLRGEVIGLRPTEKGESAVVRWSPTYTAEVPVSSLIKCEQRQR